MTVPLHLASVMEAIGDAVPHDPALRHGDRILTWAEFDDAAARVASYLVEVGCVIGSKVAILSRNSPEYLIAHHGALKARCVPINVNYRYVDAEIEYLLANADAEVVIAQASLVEPVLRSRPQLPLLRDVLAIGSAPSACTDWGDVLRTYDPAPRWGRSEDDHYMLYTGGTTGMPKGVVFRMGDFVRRMFTGYVYRGWPMPTSVEAAVAQLLQRRGEGARRVSIPACPLMHGTGMWLGAFYAQLMGGCVVTLTGERFDADELWSTVERQRVDALAIVGDAFARPMLDAMISAHAKSRPYDLSSLRVIQSSGVMWSAEVQRGLLEHLDVTLVDSMGSTEGAMARRSVTRATPIETARFEPLAGTRVLVGDPGSGWRDVVPGSGEVGRVAACSVVPLGYFKDDAKTEATFPTIDGVRYSMAGDLATVDAEGRIALLGRGSACINSMGEKVFAEEVEECIKRFAGVVDALVVPVPDHNGADRVGAVIVAPQPLDESALDAHLRASLAAYKLPRVRAVVVSFDRAPNGKPDYAAARDRLLR